ncbi:MAG: DUF2382 domain-containing protein [Cytophagaceae bacterium]
MKHTVVAVYNNSGYTQKAVDELLTNGFDLDDIDVSATEENREHHNKEKVGGFFGSLFGNKENKDYQYYSEAGERGTIITVHTDTREHAELAANILDRNGAINPSENYNKERKEYEDTSYITSAAETDIGRDKNFNYSGEANIAGDVGYDAPKEPAGYKEKQQEEIKEGASIPVVEETMNVGKRTETDQVRIYSRIFDKPIEKHLRLRIENIVVERNPVNRIASESELESFKEGTQVITAKREVPEVTKEARVVEEVKIRKESEEKDEVIRGRVRRQDVEVDKKKTDKEKKPNL